MFKVSGRVGHNKATGRWRFSGHVKAENGQTLDCDSGKLEWKRGPELESVCGWLSRPAARLDPLQPLALAGRQRD